jgi:hypothetical protein
MTLPYQDTTTAIVGERNYRSEYQLPNVTNGGKLNLRFYPLTMGSNLLNPARQVISQIKDTYLAKEADKLLAVIQEMIMLLQRHGNDLSYLPPFRAFSVDDGSLLIEWTFTAFRVGFSIEIDPKDSGWYLVTNKSLGEINASGFISDANLKSIIPWLFGFVLLNT